MATPPPDDIQCLDLADYLTLAGAALDLAPEAVFDVDATIDMVVKIAGSDVEPAEVEDWIRRQLH